MKIFFAGDLHGRTMLPPLIEKLNVDMIIQVGDFGFYGWPSPEKFLNFDCFSKNKLWLTPFGNHDNWTAIDIEPTIKTLMGEVKELAPNIYFVPRNNILTIDGLRFLFLGGAVSADARNRKREYDWWDNEAPSKEEIDTFKTILESDSTIDVIVTHEGPAWACPFRYANSILNPKSQRWCDEISGKFGNIFPISKNVFWFFGHHHGLKETECDNIKAYCCGYHGQGYIFDTKTKEIVAIEKIVDYDPEELWGK